MRSAGGRRPRHLGILTGIYPPDIGGPATYLATAAARLREQGYTVTMLTWADRLLGPDASRDGLHAVLRRGTVAGRYTRTLVRAATLFRCVDLVFACGLYPVAVLVSRILGKPLVSRIVGDEAWERVRVRGMSYETLEEFQKSRHARDVEFWKFLRSWPARTSARVVVPSRYLARIVRGWGVRDNRLCIIPNPVPGDLVAASEEPRETNVCVTVARLEPWKGLDVLLRCLQRLPGVRLVVLGDGSASAALRAQAGRLGLNGRVEFRGVVGRGELRTALSRSSVFVLASEYEGYPHAVLEAMALGTPVAATAAGGTCELIRHGVDGLLAPVGDAEALTAAIRALLEDSALARRLAASARELAHSRDHGWDAHIERLTEVFNDAG